MDLRYGENPHQKAAMYADDSGAGVAHAVQVQGKELSYNNIVDLQAAWDLAQEFAEPVCAIIKHTNPCGTATGKTLAEAYVRALACDPVSAFGGVIGVNRAVDAAAAAEMAKLFLEVIAAPAFDAGAREAFSSKKNLRLVEVPAGQQKWILKDISGGILVQDADLQQLAESDLKVAIRNGRRGPAGNFAGSAWPYIYDLFSLNAFNADGNDQEIAIFRCATWENCQDWCRDCNITIVENLPNNLQPGRRAHLSLPPMPQSYGLHALRWHKELSQDYH